MKGERGDTDVKMYDDPALNLIAAVLKRAIWDVENPPVILPRTTNTGNKHTGARKGTKRKRNSNWSNYCEDFCGAWNPELGYWGDCATRWFLSDSYEFLSFNHTCDVLGLNKREVLRRVKLDGEKNLS